MKDVRNFQIDLRRFFEISLFNALEFLHIFYLQIYHSNSLSKILRIMQNSQWNN